MTLFMPPSPNFRASRFQLETNTQRFESPLTKAVQRMALGGVRWRATYTLPKMDRSKMAVWQSFLLQLQGGLNTFYGFDPDAKSPRGSGAGTPLVEGANQTGSQLLVDGFVIHDQSPLKIGDYFSVNGELKMVTFGQNPGQNVIADSSGQAFINFQPPLRNSPPDDAPLTVLNPACTMILVDDNQSIWQTDQNSIYSEMTFSALEVFS